MPLRPPPYTWVLRSLELVLTAARAICEELGFEVSLGEDDGTTVIAIEGDASAVEAAAERYDSYRDDIESPEDEERYHFAIRLLAPDQEDPRARVEVLPYDDNWAAWSVVGPLAEEVADRVGGVEITGDPPYWMQAELATAEPPTPAALPLLALRAPIVFPGTGTTTTFGRAASVSVLERLLARGETRVALVLQSDPANEELPSGLEDVERVAVDARILRAGRQDQGFIIAFKGICRVRVTGVDASANPARVRVEAVTPVACSLDGFAALRDFARLDPMVADAAGTSLLARIEELDAGFVADLVAKANGDPALATRALLETDPSKRARLVEAAVRDA